MPDHELTLVVSVDTDAATITGDVLGPGGVTPFDGWTELIEALDRARTDQRGAPRLHDDALRA